MEKSQITDMVTEAVTRCRESDNTCYQKAQKRGDLTFTLVGQDLSSPTIICEWIKQNVETCSAEKLHEALRRAILMRDRNDRKHAD